MKSGKWIENVAPDMPISEVASDSIEVRLRRVDHALQLAARSAPKSIKYVHQFRVATRRADSTLRLFENVLPDRRRRRIAKQLKRMRRAAGKARDLDVLCARITREVEPSHPDVLNGIIKGLRQKRQRAQLPIRRIYKQAKKEGFRQDCSGLVRRIRWRGEGAEPTYRELALATLKPLADDFFNAGRADLQIPDNLHKLRIAGKQLRYGLELLSAGLHPIIRTDVYPVFSKIQEILGDINDHVVAKELFECWLVQTNGRKTTSEVARLINIEQEKYDLARRTFDEWWTPETVARLTSQFDVALLSDELPADLAS